MDTPENAAPAIAELTSDQFHSQPFTSSVERVPVAPDLLLRHSQWCDAEDDPSAGAANSGSSGGYPSNPPTPKIPFFTKEDFPAPAALAAVHVGHAEGQQLKLDEVGPPRGWVALFGTC
jgi:hypothetical protein